jgi:uncharacterized protein (DUF1778 family)
MAMNLRLRKDQHDALKERAELEGRSMHTLVLQAVDRYLGAEADKDVIAKIGSKYASAHADLLKRLGE